MAVVGELFVSLQANSAEFVQDMGKAATSVEKAGQRIQKQVTEIKEAFEGIAALIGFEKIVEAAGEAQQAVQQLQAVITSTGDACGMTVEQVEQLSESLGQLTGTDDAVINSMESLLLGFRNMSSAILPQASKAVLDLAAHFKMDIPAAAMMMGKALAEPEKGLTALQKRIGALAPDQVNMIKNFTKTGDVLDAQKVVLDAVASATNNASEAARNNLGGALKAVQASAVELFNALSGGEGGGLRYGLELVNVAIQDLRANAGTLQIALQALGAALLTLAAMKIPEYFAKTAAALASMSAQGRIALGLAALVGVFTALYKSCSMFAESVNADANVVGWSVKFMINSFMQLGAVVADVASATFKLFNNDFSGSAKAVQQASVDMNRDFVGQFVDPAKKQLEELNQKMQKWKNDLEHPPTIQQQGGDPTNHKGDAKAAQQALRYQEELNREKEAYLQLLATEQQKGEQIMQNLRDQLATETEKTRGASDEQSQMRKINEELAKTGQFYMDNYETVQKLVKGIAALRAEQAAQKKTVDEIFKSTSNVFEKQQQIGMAYLTEQINQKQYAESEQKIADLKQKEAERAIKAAMQQDKVGQDIITQLNEQNAAMRAKVEGERQITAQAQLEAKVMREINDPVKRAQVLAAGTKILANTEELNEKYRQQKQMIDDIIKSHMTQAQKVKDIKTLVDQGTVSYELGNDAVQKMKQSNDQLVQSVQSLAMNLTNTFASAITGGQKFQQVLKSLMSDVLRMIVKLVVMDTLMAALKSFINPFSIGGNVSALGAAAAAQGAASAAIGAFAGGGRPPVGQPYLVGENGPEIRIDDSPGAIYTMQQIQGLTRQNTPGGGSGAAMNPGAVTVQVMNNNGSQVNASATTDPAGNRLLQIAVDTAVTKACKSGGQLWNLLAQNGLALKSQPA